MPHSFVQVGKHWINLVQVASIELRSSRKNPKQIIAARVHFINGKYRDFKETDAVQGLVNWLRSHNPP